MPGLGTKAFYKEILVLGLAWRLKISGPDNLRPQGLAQVSSDELSSGKFFYLSSETHARKTVHYSGGQPNLCPLNYFLKTFHY